MTNPNAQSSALEVKGIEAWNQRVENNAIWSYFLSAVRRDGGHLVPRHLDNVQNTAGNNALSVYIVSRVKFAFLLLQTVMNNMCTKRKH